MYMEAKNNNNKNMEEDNIVRIGNKPPFAYLTAVVIKMTKFQDIVLTGFGIRIDKAIKVAELSTKYLRVKNEGMVPIQTEYQNHKINGISIKLKREF